MSNPVSKLKALNGKTVTIQKLSTIQKELAKSPVTKELSKKLYTSLKNAKANGYTSLKLSLTITTLKQLEQAEFDYKYVKHDEEGNLLFGVEELTQQEAHELGALDGLGSTSRKSIYKIISDRILQIISQPGKLMWRKEWSASNGGNSSLPHNYITGKNYRGVNLWYLLSWGGSNSWLTKKQIQERGGKLKEGAKGREVAFYFKGKAETIVDEDGNIKSKTIAAPAMLYYIVYNLDDTIGVKPINRKSETVKVNPIQTCEEIVEMMPKRPPITNDGGDRAFYSPGTDSVHMPKMEAFKQEQYYYATLFHELVHSTGHSKRLKRDLTGTFGSKSYAKEELVAELGASFLCGEAGILYYTLDNSAAYVAGWRSRLINNIKDDSKFFFKAASDAQRAADFMLSQKLKKEREDKKKSTKITYKLGDKFKSNFDFEGMFNYGLTNFNVEYKKPENVKTIRKLHDSFESVNYHTGAKYLWAALQSTNSDEFDMNIFEFKKYCLKETGKKNIRIKYITVKGTEGSPKKYGNLEKVKHSTYLAVNEAYKAVADDIKEEGGDYYNKSKCTVFFEDGFEYEARMEINASKNYDNPYKSNNIVGEHIKDFIKYQRDNSKNEETRKMYALALEIYQLEDSPLKTKGKSAPRPKKDPVKKNSDTKSVPPKPRTPKEKAVPVAKKVASRKRVSRNAKVAPISAVIKDLLQLPKYKKMGAMLINMFYSNFKNTPIVELKDDEGLKYKLFEKMEFDFGLIEGNNLDYILLPDGIELLDKINARRATLTAKKQGTDLFPSLAGKKKQPLGSAKTIDANTFTNETMLQKTNELFGDSNIPNSDNIPNEARPSESKGVVSAEQLAKMEYESLPFTGQWFDFIGLPPTNFKAIIYGQPGFGKSTLMLRFANYIKQFGKTLFATSEEFGAASLSEKIKRLNVKGVDFAGNIQGIDLSQYQFVFLDSINDMRMNLMDFKELKAKYPNTAFILILQSTKSGSFKGGQEWPHEVEIQIEGFKNSEGQSIAKVIKNRYLHKDSTGEFDVFG